MPEWKATQRKHMADTAYDAFWYYDSIRPIHCLSYMSLPAVRVQLCHTTHADSKGLSQQSTKLHKALFPTAVIQGITFFTPVRSSHTSLCALRHTVFLSHVKIWYAAGCHKVWPPLHSNIQVLLNFQSKISLTGTSSVELCWRLT